MSRLSRPPYFDPTTGVVYDADKAEFEGYLTKQSMWLRVRIASANRSSSKKAFAVRDSCAQTRPSHVVSPLLPCYITVWPILNNYNLSQNSNYHANHSLSHTNFSHIRLTYRTGDEDTLSSRDLDYSSQKLQMRHPTVWLTWVDALPWNRRI